MKKTSLPLRNLFTLLLCLLGVITLIRFLSASTPNRFKLASSDHISTDEKCDLFTGQWIPYPNGSSYTRTSCKLKFHNWINCFKHGRMDTEYINWRWKPNGCELPRFDANVFLQIVQNKKMLFLGDSVARNQMGSLLCLLSQVDSPTEEVKNNPADESRTFYFKSHNFTIYFLWSHFLVLSEEMKENNTSTGSFNLYIDKVDKKWSEKLPDINYVIISDAHWFFRKNYLYEQGKLIGCIRCSDPNVVDLGLAFAIRKAFQTSLDFINGCNSCKGLVTVLRTISPTHFENGHWNTGGHCNRTHPSTEGEVKLGGMEWDVRTIQVEEIKKAKKEGRKKGQRFEVLDVTKAMLMRPDGHPNSHWDNQLNKRVNDCLHWCLPGPIDMWNDLLLEVLKEVVFRRRDEYISLYS